MKHTFKVTTNNATHIRLVDNVFGILRSFDDSVTVSPESALVNAADYCGVETPPAEVTEAPREISKLTIRRRLRDLGKEDAFDTALDGVPHARRDWDDALVILTDDPLFTTSAATLKAVLGLTDEQFKTLLAP